MDCPVSKIYLSANQKPYPVFFCTNSKLPERVLQPWKYPSRQKRMVLGLRAWLHDAKMEWVVHSREHLTSLTPFTSPLVENTGISSGWAQEGENNALCHCPVHGTSAQICAGLQSRKLIITDCVCDVGFTRTEKTRMEIICYDFQFHHMCISCALGEKRRARSSGLKLNKL